MELPYFKHLYCMKYLLLFILTIFTLTVQAQTPSVKRLADLVNMHNIDSVIAYAGKLGYVKGIEIPQIGNMYEFAITSFAKKDTSVISYSSGHHYAMNQGPLSVSLTYYAPSPAEFDILVAEIKGLGAKEKDAKENSPVHTYEYNRINISTFVNTNNTKPTYAIILDCIFW